jgi:hypothetical protein
MLYRHLLREQLMALAWFILVTSATYALVRVTASVLDRQASRRTLRLIADRTMKPLQ